MQRNEMKRIFVINGSNADLQYLIGYRGSGNCSSNLQIKVPIKREAVNSDRHFVGVSSVKKGEIAGLKLELP